MEIDSAIITPHISGRSDKDAQRMISVAYENIQRFAVGKPLVNVIDRLKVY